MTDRWNRIAELYHDALALEKQDRGAYLHEQCQGDEPLRQEVEKLLEYDAKAEGFLQRPVVNQALLPPNDSTQTIAMTVEAERIGPYHLNSLLGSGGMGEVYQATDTRLGRRVALKLLLRDMSNQRDARARFLREARSAAALHHPNIAMVFDAGEANGRLYLAMELVEGQTLRKMLGPGGLPESDVLEYALQLAAALDHAHSRGILHRDIKPENVIVETDGAAKLVDFGIAKALSADSEVADITTPGMFVGTLKYAPPEVLSGQPATRQSDLYSFGVMLFEMASGKTPFADLTGMGVVGAILHGARATLRTANAAVSEGLAEVVERGMARDPDKRYSSAAAMLAALVAVRESGGASVSAPSASSEVPSVAVLAFSNVSRDPSMDWLGLGMMETIEGELGKFLALRVVNRVRTQQVLRGLNLDLAHPDAVATLGRRLGATWVVTGSFQRSGSRIRVMPGVLNVVTGENVPTEKIDGVWDDLFDVQDRVAAGLVRALNATPVVTASRAPEGRAGPQPAPSLDAYEHYAGGRQQMNQMNRESLTQAKQHFELAISLDQNYALAYSALGSAHALTFIETANPEELHRARRHLERALELDPELGEPYPWLCYLYTRLGDVPKALTSGKLGVERQPDLAMAHYFYSGTLLFGVETGLGSYQRAIDGLIRSLELDPRIAAPWMMLAWGALETGNYSAAESVLATAWKMERTPNLPFRFVGARTMLGLVHGRKRDWHSARKCHQESIESLRDAQHVYRNVFTTLSACALGEIGLRTGERDEAMAHFRHAWRLVKEEPRMLGNVRLGIRTQAGMAAAYAVMGERDRAEQHLAEAASRIASLESTSATFELLLPNVHYSVAVALQYLGLTADSIVSLSRAMDTGWADAHWLQEDPVWAALQDRKDYRHLVERVRLIPPVTVDLNRVPLPETVTSSAGTAPPS